MLHSELLDSGFSFVARALSALVSRHRDERGFSTLMVAMVSVAGGATILASTTMTSADMSFEALSNTVRSSVDRVSASLEVRGSVIARSSGAAQADSLEFTLSVFGEGSPIQLASTGDAPGELTINYRDGETYVPAVPYTAAVVRGDGDSLLEHGELASVVVDLSQIPQASLEANERFSLELMSPVGGTIEIARTMPFVLQPVMSLH